MHNFRGYNNLNKHARCAVPKEKVGTRQTGATQAACPPSTPVKKDLILSVLLFLPIKWDKKHAHKLIMADKYENTHRTINMISGT